MRKPPPSAVIKTLPDEDQEALFEFLRNHTLAEGVTWLFSNNGVRTNDSSLSEWRGWYAMNQEIDGWNADVKELERRLGTETTISPNLIPKIGEAVFISKAAKSGDAKTFALVAGIIQRHKELESNQQVHADKMDLEGRKLKRKDRGLDQSQKKLEQAERKIAALEAQAIAASKKLNELRDPAKAEDPKMRQLILDEVDRAMGIKKS
jgi:hypothetical protein